jgi:transposase-like protein
MKRNFSAEFKRESAQLVLDQNYTVAAAASAMDGSFYNDAMGKAVTG